MNGHLIATKFCQDSKTVVSYAKLCGHCFVKSQEEDKTEFTSNLFSNGKSFVKWTTSGGETQLSNLKSWYPMDIFWYLVWIERKCYNTHSQQTHVISSFLSYPHHPIQLPHYILYIHTYIHCNCCFTKTGFIVTDVIWWESGISA